MMGTAIAGLLAIVDPVYSVGSGDTTIVPPRSRMLTRVAGAHPNARTTLRSATGRSCPPHALRTHDVDRTRGARGQSGQALVEFALVLRPDGRLLLNAFTGDLEPAHWPRQHDEPVYLDRDEAAMTLLPASEPLALWTTPDSRLPPRWYAGSRR
jgi:hypothetical protein